MPRRNRRATEGEIVEGRVIAISDLGVVVDIGGKSEGLIPAQEFLEADQPITFQSGQTIEVQLTGEHKEGYAVLSYQRAHRRRVWANLEKAYHEKTNVTGRVVDRVKGGLVVDVGVRAFLARLAGRSPAGARPRRVEGSRNRSPRPEAEPQARQCGGQPPRDPREASSKPSAKS